MSHGRGVGFFVCLLEGNDVLNFDVYDSTFVEVLAERLIASFDLFSDFDKFSFFDSSHECVESIDELNLFGVGFEEVGLCFRVIGLSVLKSVFFVSI